MSEQLMQQWRTAVRRNKAVDESDAAELEAHLRDAMADLEGAGLSADEAFLIAVRRVGTVDALTAEFAREHSDRLWKQLVVAPTADPRPTSWPVMLIFAVVAAVAVQLVRVAASAGGTVGLWLVHDLSLFVLPVLAAYFVVVRRMRWRGILPLAAIVAVLALAVNLFPYHGDRATEFVVAIHLPIVLWFVVGAAYLGGEWRSSDRRMDFVRFTGEWIVYYALIALAGGVLVALMEGVLSLVSPDVAANAYIWVVPSGAAGAVLVAAWLVEAKKSVIENIAPVLTAIFTPIFAAMLLVTTVIYAVTAFGRTFDRNSLGLFDALLVVVVGLVIYGISARSTRRPGLMDALRLTAVVAAVLLDLLVLVAMVARVGEFGFTANRVAALGLNLVLLVDLVVTAVVIVRMLRRRTPVLTLERWQTSYLLVIAAWVTVVVLVLPPVFGFA
ncbi:MAG TPA: permease prefix domain 1-containing protein [Pseudolysinimonas sp.]|nr:permease prefix domain 1-containing protein [Pseudolysinimonas sp.]